MTESRLAGWVHLNQKESKQNVYGVSASSTEAVFAFYSFLVRFLLMCTAYSRFGFSRDILEGSVQHFNCYTTGGFHRVCNHWGMTLARCTR